MNELDLAVLFIFVLGVYGMKVEPWSPHPLPMAVFGVLYFGARIAVHIVMSKLIRKE